MFHIKLLRQVDKVVVININRIKSTFDFNFDFLPSFQTSQKHIKIKQREAVH